MSSSAASAVEAHEWHPGETAALDPQDRVLVVGASLAGLRTAQGLRDLGFSGSITLVGEELHQPYDRPPLSKQVLAGTWPPERAVLADHHLVHELGVELVLGQRAVGLDVPGRSLSLEDGSRLEGDRIVIATGATPRWLPTTEGLPGVHVLRTLDDALALRQEVLAAGAGARVVVVGAGFIGSEVAATCHGLGCEVTVVEALPVPLAQALGEQVGAAVASLHARNGVRLLTGAGVAGVHPPSGGGGPPAAAEGRAGRVVLTDGTSLPADVVVVGIGVVPAVGWLADSGLVLDNGVVCDGALFAKPGILAAGDLARWRWPNHGAHALTRIEHWEVAAQMGAAAARSLMAGSREAPAFDPVPYFWSDQYNLRIQMLGRPLPSDEVVVVDGSFEAEDGKFVAVYGRQGRLTAAIGISRPRKLMAFRAALVEGASFDRALKLLAEES